MTIGAEPITRTERMEGSRGIRSSHAARGHLLHELAEQVVAVVRARARLGVVLDGKNGKLPVAESLDRTVVQVDVGQLVFRLREERRIDGEAVVLGRDLDLAGAQILDRMIGSSVPELELERLPAARQAEDLVSEADAEDRAAADEVARRANRVG